MSKAMLDKLGRWAVILAFVVVAAIAYGSQAQQVKHNTGDIRQVREGLPEIRKDVKKILEGIGELKGKAHSHGS